MGLGPVIVTIVIILVISAVVGAIAQFLNKVNDANAVNRRVVPPPAARPQLPANTGNAANPTAAAPGKQVADMDRFLAEIDRLRRKNAQAAPPPEPAKPAQPVKPPERSRQRVMAEVAEPPRGTSFPSAPPLSFPSAPPAPPSGLATRLDELPMAVLAPSSATGAPTTRVTAPATRVTAPARRAVPTPKTAFGKEFAALLGTGKGAAMAVVLTQVLGPPKARRRGGPAA